MEFELAVGRGIEYERAFQLVSSVVAWTRRFIAWRPTERLEVGSGTIIYFTSSSTGRLG